MVSIPLNITLWIAAAGPIVFLLLAMVVFQFPLSKVAPISFLMSILTAIVFYRAGFKLLLFESLKGLWSALPIVTVIISAVLLYEISDQAKSFLSFRKELHRITGNELLQIIIIGWTFSAFMQGITGFGVPVAVCAPLLLSIGVSPIYSVIIPLFGHAWANTFGTLGLAWSALAESAGLTTGSAEFSVGALWASAFLAVFNVIGGLMICWIYGKKEGVKLGFPACMVISSIHCIGQAILSQINASLAAFIPTSLCLIGAIMLGKTKWYSNTKAIDSSPCIDRSRIITEPENHADSLSLFESLFPYIVLLVMTVICLVIKPVNTILGSFKIGFSFPETSTGYGFTNPYEESYSPISPFTHAGVLLCVSSVVSFYYYQSRNKLKSGDRLVIIKKTLHKVKSSVLSVTMMLMMSKVMTGSGQIEILAQGTAITLKNIYLLFVPFVGMLGSFITGSNMASNILFGRFQTATAVSLGYDICTVLGGQTAGAAIGNIISPSNIVLGCSAVGIIGKEGKIIRYTFPISVMATAVIGLILIFSGL